MVFGRFLRTDKMAKQNSCSGSRVFDCNQIHQLPNFCSSFEHNKLEKFETEKFQINIFNLLQIYQKINYYLFMVPDKLCITNDGKCLYEYPFLRKVRRFTQSSYLNIVKVIISDTIHSRLDSLRYTYGHLFCLRQALGRHFKFPSMKTKLFLIQWSFTNWWALCLSYLETLCGCLLS